MKKQFGKIFAILAAAAILILGMITGRYLESSKKPELNTSAITAQISELSQLSTAELAYRGLVRYSQGEITFLTKKEFTMIYDANVKAGVDLGQVQVDIKGNKVSVTLPKAEIQDITIDPDSLEFYDEKFALFNFQDRQDTVEALQYAKEDVTKQAEKTDLLTTAEERAKTVITELVNSMWNQEDTKPEITFETAADTQSESSAAN